MYGETIYVVCQVVTVAGLSPRAPRVRGNRGRRVRIGTMFRVYPRVYGETQRTVYGSVLSPRVGVQGDDGEPE